MKAILATKIPQLQIISNRIILTYQCNSFQLTKLVPIPVFNSPCSVDKDIVDVIVGVSVDTVVVSIGVVVARDIRRTQVMQTDRENEVGNSQNRFTSLTIIFIGSNF